MSLSFRCRVVLLRVPQDVETAQQQQQQIQQCRQWNKHDASLLAWSLTRVVVGGGCRFLGTGNAPAV
jgi:hypothetical protein